MHTKSMHTLLKHCCVQIRTTISAVIRRVFSIFLGFHFLSEWWKGPPDFLSGFRIPTKRILVNVHQLYYYNYIFIIYQLLIIIIIIPIIPAPGQCIIPPSLFSLFRAIPSTCTSNPTTRPFSPPTGGPPIHSLSRGWSTHSDFLHRATSSLLSKQSGMCPPGWPQESSNRCAVFV